MGRSPTQKGGVHLFGNLSQECKDFVAVLPKKEGFIYNERFAQCYIYYRRSPTQKGGVHLSSRMSQMPSGYSRSPTQKGVVHLYSNIRLVLRLTVAVLPKKEWFIYQLILLKRKQKSVAVLPKKEWFIYAQKIEFILQAMVAVLPKKEWFIYQEHNQQMNRIKSS